MKEQFVVKKDELQSFTERFLSSLDPQDDRATVVGLVGNLGAGKTTFTQALARTLSVVGPVTSPTYVIKKSYELGEEAVFKKLIHIDAYRLESGEELEALGFKDDLESPQTLVVIEWPERVEGVMPDVFDTLEFEVVDHATRTITHHAYIQKTEK